MIDIGRIKTAACFPMISHYINYDENQKILIIWQYKLKTYESFIKKGLNVLWSAFVFFHRFSTSYKDNFFIRNVIVL